MRLVALTRPFGATTAPLSPTPSAWLPTRATPNHLKYVIVFLKSWTESRGGHNYLLISFGNPLTLSEIILLSDDLKDRLSIRGSGLVVGREVATPSPEQEVERTPAI
jgi:hypothetical protein